MPASQFQKIWTLNICDELAFINVANIVKNTLNHGYCFLKACCK